MSKLKIDLGIELGSSLSKLKSIEDQLLKLLPATGQVTNTLKGVKDSINNINVNKLQDVPQVFKAIIPSVNDVKKAFDNLAQTQALDRLNQAVADATASILLFSQGSASLEDLLPVLARLTQEAGGLDKGLALLQDLPNFDEFIGGLEEGVALVEKFGEAATDINFDPNNTLTKKLKEARTNLDAVTAAFGVGSAEANQAAEAVAQINDQIKLQRDLVQGTDLAGKFELAGRALGGVASAFQTVSALQVAFGDKSKETEEALKKVQAVMAFTQGIEGLLNSRKAIEALGSSGLAAFRSLTTGIATATGATRGLAAAIAATGIGLLVVGIGVAISAIDDYNSKIDEAAEATGKLREENERLASALKKTFANSQPELDRQTQIIRNEEKIKDLQAKGGDNQKEINKLRRENLQLSIQSGQAEIATLDGIADGQELLTVKSKVFRDQQALTRIGYEETATAAEKAAEKQKKLADELKKKQEEILKVNETLQSKLKDIEIGIQLGQITDGGLEERLKAFQEAAKQYLKLGFSVDSEQIQTLLRQISETKLQLFKPVRIQTPFEIELQELENADNLRKQVEEKFKRFRELKPIQLKLIEPSYDQQSVFAKFRDQATGAVDGFEESKDKILDISSTLSSGLADTFGSLGETIGKAIAEGGNVFEAIGNTLLSSLGDLLVNIGKQIIAANIVIEKAKLTFAVPVLGVLAGVAVVALGNIIKASIAKQSKKGFATGGFVSGPGTETSDSIPARLSKGEYVIRAKSVRKYGARTLEKLNKGEVPVAVMARATGRSGGSGKVLVNKNEETALQDLKQILTFSNGGLVNAVGITRNGGTSKALVNRMSLPIPTTNIPQPNISETFTREVPYIATTKVSGQDLRIILERADRRYSTAT